MTNIRTIGGMWLAGAVSLLASVISFGLAAQFDLAVPGVAAFVFLFVAVPLLLLAWGAALCKAIADDEGGWVIGLFFVPGVVMWLYLLTHVVKAGSPNSRRPAHDSGEPLWMRQAGTVIEDAERRYPEW